MMQDRITGATASVIFQGVASFRVLHSLTLKFGSDQPTLKLIVNAQKRGEPRIG
jgi:hypothetical protein